MFLIPIPESSLSRLLQKRQKYVVTRKRKRGVYEVGPGMADEAALEMQCHHAYQIRSILTPFRSNNQDNNYK